MYIYRRTAGALDKSEWHFIRTPLPEGTPICHTSTSFGIEVDGGPRRNGIAAGLLTQAVSSVPDKRDSGVLSLVYDADHKERTYVYISDNP